MTLRAGLPADLPRLLAIRDAAGADALSDPRRIGEPMLRRRLGTGDVAVWQEDGAVCGFVAVDGATLHLLVDSAARGQGIGRALLAEGCRRLAERGTRTASLSLPPAGTAEPHYRVAGWRPATGSAGAARRLQKPL
ncbi:MAG TPA: GNAT family N-acetyltransferase [Stellaceae bacterium]|nr:GNAT family N-acetyltransferase [Stellaceae bacterium]